MCAGLGRGQDILVIFCLSPQRLKSECHFSSVTDKLRGICALALSVLISALPLTPLHLVGKYERAEGTTTVSRATAGLDRCLSLFSLDSEKLAKSLQL